MLNIIFFDILVNGYQNFHRNVKMWVYRKKYKVSPGFSALELIVAVAILAVLTAVAIPNILNYLPKSRLNGAARVIAGDLAAARMAAVKQNCRAAVMFMSNGHSYYIWVDEDNDNTQDDGEMKTRDLYPQFHDVVYDPDESTALRIGFNSRGTGSGIGTFEIKNASGSKRIVVNLAGRIKIR